MGLGGPVNNKAQRPNLGLVCKSVCKISNLRALRYLIFVKKKYRIVIKIVGTAPVGITRQTILRTRNLSKNNIETRIKNKRTDQKAKNKTN